MEIVYEIRYGVSRVHGCYTPRIGRRIVVVGTTGSGKSTLAGRLAQILRRPYIEFDALYWDPEWTPAPGEVFRARVRAALEPDEWVADGNYSAIRDIVWPRADTLVWLDYPLRTILWRLARRTLARIVTREELWNGNRERFVHQFRRDSIILWALQTHRRRQREYRERLRETHYGHLQVIHLRSPSETRTWLTTVLPPETGMASGTSPPTAGNLAAESTTKRDG